MGILKKIIEAIKCKCSCTVNDNFCQDNFKTQIDEIQDYKFDFGTARKLSMLLGKLDKKKIDL